MKLACIRSLPKNKNSVIDQSQRTLYAYFLMLYRHELQGSMWEENPPWIYVRFVRVL